MFKLTRILMKLCKAKLAILHTMAPKGRDYIVREGMAREAGGRGRAGIETGVAVL